MKKHYKKTKNLFLLVLTLQLFTNCDYEFSEDYFKEIKQEAPIATLSLNDFTDNKTLYTPLNVSFYYDGKDRHRLYEIQIYIDNNLIKSSSINTGDFLIDTEGLIDGSHKLRIEYIFSSGSSSLADIYNIEAYIKIEEYNFTVDKSPPETITITSAEIIDGTIYIEWNPISKTNFKRALLLISTNGNWNFIELSLEDLLKQSYNDTFVNSDFDSNEIGYNLSYKIELRNTRGTTSSNSVNLHYDEVSHKREIVGEDQYKLIISKHPLYNSFDYYSFKNSSGSETYRIESTGGEVIINDHVKFPQTTSNNFSLYKESSIGEDIYRGSLFLFSSYSKEFQNEGYFDFSFSSDNILYALKLKNQSSGFISKKDVFINKLNPDNLSSIQSIKIATIDHVNAFLTIDPITDNLIVDLGDITYLLNRSNYAIINQWSLSEFNTVDGDIIYRNNLIIIKTSNQVSIYNATTKEQIFTTANTDYFNISDNGLNFYINGGIYEIKNNLISLIIDTNSDNSINSVLFITDLNKCVINNFNSNPVIYDFSTNTKTILSNFTKIIDIQYDKITNKLFLAESYNVNGIINYAHFYDMATKKIKSLDCFGGNVSFKPDRWVWFINGTFFTLSGYYLDYYINE